MHKEHEQYMHESIAEAERAAAMHEVPIGAVAVVDGTIIARVHNLREATGDPLGHAELLLLQQLTKGVTRDTCDVGRGVSRVTYHAPQNWRLTDVTIYVTCEPCLMCAGALLQARIPQLVYGCKDPKAGACGSLYDVTSDARLNHRIEVTSGVLADECGALLSNFFRRLRKESDSLSK